MAAKKKSTPAKKAAPKKTAPKKAAAPKKVAPKKAAKPKAPAKKTAAKSETKAPAALTGAVMPPVSTGNPAAENVKIELARLATAEPKAEKKGFFKKLRRRRG